MDNHCALNDVLWYHRKMNTMVEKIKIEWILRISLGLMYLYSSIDLMMHPKSWTWAVPWWFSRMVTPFVPLDVYLQFQGGIELLMALIFLALFWKGGFVLLVVIFSSLELLFILFFSPQFATTFRDIGVLGASVTLCLLLWERLYSSHEAGEVRSEV